MISSIIGIITIILSIIDIGFTEKYIIKYKKWQPNKPFKEIEKNVILLYAFNKWGLKKGMFWGGLIVFIINLFVIIFGPIWLVMILAIIIFVTIINHNKNMKMLKKLIKKYPTGHLPKKTFGKVVGNNPKSEGGNLR